MHQRSLERQKWELWRALQRDPLDETLVGVLLKTFKQYHTTERETEESEREREKQKQSERDRERESEREMEQKRQREKSVPEGTVAEKTQKRLARK